MSPLPPSASPGGHPRQRAKEPAISTGRPPRRLGAIGTLVWDSNWHPSLITGPDQPLRQWGGAAYSFASLSATCPPGWVVQPIVKIGADLERPALQHLRTLPNLHIGQGVQVVPEPNNRVELRYYDSAHRTELLTGGVPPWSWEELEPIVSTLDALYVNFISGFELDLATARALRASFGGPMYTDLHSLFLTRPGEGPRAPRPLDRWEEWVGCFDSIQLNEAEWDLLHGDRTAEEFVPDLLSRGPRLVAVTLGGAGVHLVAPDDLPTDPLAWRSSPRTKVDWRGTTVPAPLGELPGDPTGCGDVWGAAFVTGTLEGLTLEAAVARAQLVAAAKITHPRPHTLRAHLSDALRERIRA